MIKDISRRKTEYPHGRISISVDDLIRIIESKNFTNVTAENGNTEFENLDDIKQHRSLMAGEPRIICDDIWISFSRYGGNVSLGWGDRGEPSIAKSISLEIRKHKSLIDFISDNTKYIWTVHILAFIFWGFINLYFTSQDFPTGVYDTINWIALSIFFAVFIILIWAIYADNIRKAVYFRKDESFIRRNFDKIILTVFSAICGAIITFIFGRFFL